MTYELDFRRGMAGLPTHARVKLPELAAYEAWIKSRPPKGQCRASPSAAQYRRIILLCEGGETLSGACRLVGGVRYDSVRMAIMQMPPELQGTVLSKRFAQ